MKLKIDDLFLNNSFKDSINLERRIVVTIPYEDKFYLLMSEMNLKFKENNPRLFGVQIQGNQHIESDETIFEKTYTCRSDLFSQMQEDVIGHLSQLNEKDWIVFCETVYNKHQKKFTCEQGKKQITRFLNFNNATIEVFKKLNREDFVLGNDQNVDEWHVFWKYIEMQKLEVRLNYKQATKVKLRKI